MESAASDKIRRVHAYHTSPPVRPTLPPSRHSPRVLSCVPLQARHSIQAPSQPALFDNTPKCSTCGKEISPSISVSRGSQSSNTLRYYCLPCYKQTFAPDLQSIKARLAAQLSLSISENERILWKNESLQREIDVKRQDLRERKGKQVGTTMLRKIQLERERIVKINRLVEEIRGKIVAVTHLRNNTMARSIAKSSELALYQKLEINPLQVAEAKLYHRISRKETILQRCISQEDKAKYFCDKCNDTIPSPSIGRKKTADTSSSLRPTKTCVQKCEIM